MPRVIYLCEKQVADLCLNHPESPWFLDDGGHVGVIDCSGDPSSRFPAEFWWVDENGNSSFIADAEVVETLKTVDDPVPLRCFLGEVLDNFDERNYWALLLGKV